MTVDEWSEAVLRAVRAISGKPDSLCPDRATKAALASVLPDPASVGPGGLTAAQRRRITSKVLANADVTHGRVPCGRAVDVLAAKLAIRLHDVSVGRWDRVPAHERGPLARAMGIAPPAVARPVHEGGFYARVAVPYRPVSRGYPDRIGRTEAVVALPMLDALDAPVACTLRTPGGEMAVRRFGDGYLRPVLAPGSWEPADVATFARAAGEGTPWRDNPFLPGQPRGSPCLALGDYADPTVDPAARDREAVEVAAREARARAGALHVIDGVVHKACGAPSVGIVQLAVADGRPGRPLVLAWQLDGLSSVDTMDTLSGAQADEVAWTSARKHFRPGRGVDRVLFPLPVRDLPLLRRAFDAWAVDGKQPELAGGPVATAVEAGLLADDPRSAVDALSALVDVSLRRGPPTDDPFVVMADVLDVDARRLDPGHVPGGPWPPVRDPGVIRLPGGIVHRCVRVGVAP